MNDLKWVIPISIMFLTGCITDADRDLYRKITISCKIVTIDPTEYRWDNIVVEFPSGERCRVQVPRGVYQLGDVFHKQMWKWQAIERAVIDTEGGKGKLNK